VTTTNRQERLKWLGLALGLLIILVIVLNPDGWGTFVRDVVASFVVQAAIALILFGMMLAFLIRFESLLPVSLSGGVLWGTFFIADVLALLLLPSIFRRPVDVYDIAQSVVLLVVFCFLAGSAGRYLRGLRDRLRKPPATRESRQTRPPATSYAEGKLYGSLLSKVLGNRETAERLIEYERRRVPGASREELIRRAIERWELDNRAMS